MLLKPPSTYYDAMARNTLLNALSFKKEELFVVSCFALGDRLMRRLRWAGLDFSRCESGALIFSHWWFSIAGVIRRRLFSIDAAFLFYIEILLIIIAAFWYFHITLLQFISFHIDYKMFKMMSSIAIDDDDMMPMPPRRGRHIFLWIDSHEYCRHICTAALWLTFSMASIESHYYWYQFCLMMHHLFIYLRARCLIRLFIFIEPIFFFSLAFCLAALLLCRGA